MKDVGDVLRAADPLAANDADRALSAADAQAIRRRMLAALDEPRSSAMFWPRPLAIAATIALALAAGVVAGRQVGRDVGQEFSPAVGAGAVRQLQFATPGGTRIIWTFNPDFGL